MNILSARINKNYALDVSLLHKVRDFNDGVSFFECSINYDKYEGDHNPRFNIFILCLNFIIFEIEIYNRNHILNE